MPIHFPMPIQNKQNVIKRFKNNLLHQQRSIHVLLWKHEDSVQTQHSTGSFQLPTFTCLGSPTLLDLLDSLKSSQYTHLDLPGSVFSFTFFFPERPSAKVSLFFYHLLHELNVFHCVCGIVVWFSLTLVPGSSCQE